VVDNGIAPAPDGQRYLFILENSSAMEDLQASNEATLFELIRSGVDGQMLAGDTFGLWTYNKTTHAGRFPMRVWEPKRSTQQATIAAAFVSQQLYEKSANMKELMLDLTDVIRAVSNLTVLLISDGSTEVHGTPFDKSINSEYRSQNRIRRHAKRPFVTTLIVRDGWYVQARVTVGGAHIELPERPPSVLALKPPPTNAPPTNANIAAAVASPSARHASPASTPAASAPSNEVASGTAAAAAATNGVVLAPPKKKMIEIVTKPPKPEPAENPEEPAKLVETGPSVPSPGASAAISSSPATASASVSTNLPGAIPPATSPRATPPPAAPAPVVAAAAPSVPAVLPFSASPPSSSAVAAAPAARPASGSTVLSALMPDPLPVAARERPVEPVSAPAPTDTSPEASASAATPLQAVSTPAAQAASPWMLYFGASMLSAVLLLLLLIFRRARPTGSGSLITQSMDRR
jgi:hypothetical protein